MSLESIDPILAAPKRLAALGVLANSGHTEFAFLRTHLSLSDSDLSKQMSTMAEAGYLTVRKTGKGRDRQTWFRITKPGRRAFEAHVAALRALIDDAPSAPDLQEVTKGA